MQNTGVQGSKLPRILSRQPNSHGSIGMLAQGNQLGGRILQPSNSQQLVVGGKQTQAQVGLHGSSSQQYLAGEGTNFSEMVRAEPLSMVGIRQRPPQQLSSGVIAKK